MKKLIRKVTWARVKWTIKTNVQSWVLQGAIAGALTVTGVGTLAALVTAKVAAYAVFVFQCVRACRSAATNAGS